MLDAYDFSPFGTVVDVGGGYGTLLAAILRRHPATQGILFDLPHVVAGAEGLLGGGRGRRPLRTVSAATSSRRCRPEGTPTCSRRSCTTGTTTARVAILRQCRQVMPDHGKLLVIEQVLPQGEEPSSGSGWTCTCS